MHSRSMRIACFVDCLCCMHVSSLPFTPSPAMHATSMPHTHLYYTCPPRHAHPSPATHPPCRTCLPSCMTPCHACPLPHVPLAMHAPTMYAPCHACLPCHTCPLPCMFPILHALCHASPTPATHAPTLRPTRPLGTERMKLLLRAIIIFAF